MKRAYDFFLWLIGATAMLLSPLAIASAREVSYAHAYAAYQLGQPMVVICSADFCGNCHALINQLNDSDVQFTVCHIDKPTVAGEADKAALHHGEPLPLIAVWVPAHEVTIKVPASKTNRTGNIGLVGVRALLQGK